MSLEVFEQLEGKVQRLVDSVELLQLEIEELRQQNSQLSQENQTLKSEHSQWQDRLRALIGKMDQLGEAL